MQETDATTITSRRSISDLVVASRMRSIWVLMEASFSMNVSELGI